MDVGRGNPEEASVTTMTEPTVEVRPYAEDVVDSAPAARWAVEEHAWADLAPALSADVIALVAPSVVVCAQLTDSAG
jgi:hypothetical protein